MNGVLKQRCPRAGAILLGSYPIKGKEYRYWFPTTCKTYKCLVCSPTVVAEFRYKVLSAILMGGQYDFITLTLRLGRKANWTQGMTGAADFALMWEAWLKRMYRTFGKIPWLRVMEATKNGMPHAHLIVGGLPSKRHRSCTGKNTSYSLSWLAKSCKADCLEHEIARMWYEVTGDSFIVDVRAIYGAEGAASYLGDYVGKAMQEFDVLKQLGFSRRYSRSRNFPAGRRVRLVGTEYKLWKQHYYEPNAVIGKMAQEANDKVWRGQALYERVGDYQSLWMAERIEKVRLKSKAKGLAERFGVILC